MVPITFYSFYMLFSNVSGAFGTPYTTRKARKQKVYSINNTKTPYKFGADRLGLHRTTTRIFLKQELKNRAYKRLTNQKINRCSTSELLSI